MSVILETRQLCKFYGAGENQDVYKRQQVSHLDFSYFGRTFY